MTFSILILDLQMLQSEEGKYSAEKETVKAFDVPECTPNKVEKTIPEDAPVKVEVEKAQEVSPEEKKTEEAKPAVVAENVAKTVENLSYKL